MYPKRNQVLFAVPLRIVSKKGWLAIPAITEKLGRLMAWRKSHDGEEVPPKEEQPLRAELFSVEQLERHAKELAASHKLATGRAPDKLIARLNENEAILVHCYDMVTAAVKRKRRIAPAAEWLLDNFYLIEEQIRTARRHLPQSYSRELPRLANGPAASFPRAYGIALELISHVDGRVDAVSLNGFIAAYQTITPLKLGELWAVPIMLRLALIENLRRVAARVTAGRKDGDLADDWAERMVTVVEQNPTDLILVMADMARANPPLSGAFLAEMTRHLQGQSPYFAFANSWLENRLAEQGLTTSQLILAEGQGQAADQVSIGNSINSLRFLSSNEWRKFVEDHSLVEKILREDPAGVYPNMDFATRDQYRHVVEGIAKHSPGPEHEVASKSIRLAEGAAAGKMRIDLKSRDSSANHHVPSLPPNPQDMPTAHVGYYLIGKGRTVLEHDAAMRPTPGTLAAKFGHRYPLFLYLSSIFLLTGIATVAFFPWLHEDVGPFVIVVLAIPFLMCALNLGIGMTLWLSATLIKPRRLPRMDFSLGIPAEHRTMVVVPTMLSSAEGLRDLLDDLEVRYLANRDNHIHFALLTDFEDAPQETLPKDAELIRLAREGIEELNRKYQNVRTDIFFLCHRPRRWCAQEGVWMGYERKRGKLLEFNALLRGAKDRFSAIVGDTGVLSEVRYVITLDTDTQLPPESAHQMVGTMAHTLNRPVIDPKQGRVVTGYGILQPRVGVSLPSARKSWFVRLFAGDSGLDPYTRMVSDVYQDIFGEGSFIGKGIYDVRAFEQSCATFPDNTVLSHDLLESAYSRSALLSDVELFEDFPSRYPADVSRRHRWIRGDWQIVWWLFPWVPMPPTPTSAGDERAWVRNPITWLSWWKIFDNLRRSLVPVAFMVLLLGSWLLAGSTLGVSATFFVLVVIGLVPLLNVLEEFLRKPVELPLWTHLRVATNLLWKELSQFFFTVVFLPYDAFISIDAITRTLVRMFWTKKNLLEWKTSSEAHRGARTDLAGFFLSMGIGPALAPLALWLAFFYPALLFVGGPLLVLWLLSPAIAWWLSRRIEVVPDLLSKNQRTFLRKLSRRTWRFFEVFVTKEENWLPPDNFQENPAPVIASRTSPTNIGMALLANLAAYDFGYLSACQLIERTQKTFTTLARMERHRGHFYNWYETRTLRPLPPLYISTVDSGNLVGHLLVLRMGLLELADAPVVSIQFYTGLSDTLSIVLDAIRKQRTASQGPIPPISIEIVHRIERLQLELADAVQPLSALTGLLDRIASLATEVKGQAGSDQEVLWWTSALERACADQREELKQLTAWTLLAPVSKEAWGQGSAEQIVRLAVLRTALSDFDTAPRLRQVARLQESMLPLLDAVLKGFEETKDDTAAARWFQQLRPALMESSRRAANRIKDLEQLARQSHELADVDFSFLFNKAHGLFSIGFNAGEHRLDGSFYDLLASEARLASYITIAQGQMAQEHWFALGRMVTTTGGSPTLLSWSGSMFEYLMPLLVMPTYENTLLDQTYKSVVRRQINYGRQRGVPWGISESGFATVDVAMNYQYRAFGVPGLGLKRGLAEDLVIAPYACALAVMAAPLASCRNLERLASEGQEGAYGFFEAIDYTPSRVPREGTGVTVRQFMAHHQGMSLLAFAYILLDKPMQRRFSADPMMRAADLLLQERVPKSCVPIYPHVAEADATRTTALAEEGSMRVYTDPNGAGPEVHLLSNSRYHVAITSAGGGYSRWRDLAVTRWREDSTRDCWGTFCYLRDLESGVVWSTAWQPTLKPTRRYQAIFTQARAEFRRRDENIDTHTEISVSPEDDVELRRITMTNRSDVARTIEVTSYSEVVLALPSQDLSHPAFSNLFVQTELVPNRQAIYCTRRPRAAEERPPWLMHLMTIQGTTIGEASFETDRMKFIGRGRTLAAPAAMERLTPLSGSEGPVLDPIVSIRQVIRLQPKETVRVDLVLGVAETRDAVTALTEKYHDPRLADRVFELAWTHSQIMLRQLNASEADAQAYGRLASSVIYASSLRRAKASILTSNRRGQSGLWGYGISGDIPIVLVRLRDRARLELVRQAVHAHAYWRLKGVQVDLVIWNEDDSVYRQSLQDSIMDLIAASPEATMVDKPGGIFVRRGEQMSEEDRALLQTVARVVLFDDAGTLAEQVERRGRSEVTIAALKPTRRLTEPVPPPPPRPRDLVFFNGLGGFSRDGREYVTLLPPGRTTPAPWVNVIANAQFGTVVSEAGSVYTWSENSHEFRLTPWYNDPVSGISGEAVYIRDEETGRVWSPSPLPARGNNTYVVRHGFGYSIFEYTEDGIVTELCIYVATDAPVKFVRLRVSNRSDRPRQLSFTGYWELVLGELRDKTLMHVVTELDPVSGGLFARNPYNSEFPGRIVFIDSSESNRTVTGDRSEFLGRNGTPAKPAALRSVRLSGRVGAGLDPCSAMQVQVFLEDGHEKDIVFIIGAADGEEQARHLMQRFRGPGNAYRALEGVWHYWSQTLGPVYVETPDPAVNFLANGWLIYQTLACRMWARTGFYQSGGAFGFRDQLQDAMALVHAEPGLLRQHLLRCAGRQFHEGDVQHWWHSPVGRGVRTQFSDDYLWLPYAVCRYVSYTGDTGVLEEKVPFLTARLLRPEEESNYDLPRISDEVGSLYDHCVRAIDHGLRFGAHGLPLMGCGDWNDGMNLVGIQGKGESVWLAFFLHDVLNQFADLARHRGDVALVDRYTVEAGRLRGNVEEHAWDGSWYRRAYFDDGTPLGSAGNSECQIDAIAQSWSILSGAGTRERSALGMESVEKRLVRRDARLIQLLDPPFDKSNLNPGYIKGYVPGVRENGGQYTHAAIWTVMAYAAMGDSKRAWDLFNLINPVTHAATPDTTAIYRVEPYVVAADVYAVPPHTGRGGWTWYTGSAGWMYRLITESLLGLQLAVDKLRFTPCLPAEWTSFMIHYRYRETFYHITIRQSGKGQTVNRVVLDGQDQPDKTIPLVDDRNHHNAEVEVG